ncbi:MAG: hypothetical protein JWQ38_445, partial [Flavipsychrobacter sp.]|nr:hypothetical protein [Flavipsychrobacter sp.]
TDSVGIYSTPLSFEANETRVLTKRAKLHIPGFKPFKYVTAADISKDGKQILLKTYENVYYWQRKSGEHVWETMQRNPKELHYEVQKQGEAIGFTADGKGYYTISEGAFASMYYYRLP